MKLCNAFALTPAAIISEAKAWRHSCSVMRSSPASFQALSARFVNFEWIERAVAPCKTKESVTAAIATGGDSRVEKVAEDGADRHLAATGIRLEGNLALPILPAELNPDHAVGEIDVAVRWALIALGASRAAKGQGKRWAQPPSKRWAKRQ